VARLYYFNEDRVECVVDVPEDGTPIVVGRLPGLPIVTRNITVSRRHGEVRAVGGRFVFKDLGSSNGCFYGGQRVSERVLEDGDRVYCGNFELRFEHTALPAVEPMWEEHAPAPEQPYDAPPAEEPRSGLDDVIEPLDLLEPEPVQEPPSEPERIAGPADQPPSRPRSATSPVFSTASAFDEDFSAEIRRRAAAGPDSAESAPEAEEALVRYPEEEPALDPFEPRRRQGTDAAFLLSVAEEEAASSPHPAPAPDPSPLPQTDDERDDELRRLRIEVESLSATLAALNAAEDSSARVTDEETTRLRVEVERLSVENQELQSLREQVEAAKDHVGALEKRVVAGNEKVGELSNEVAALNGQIEEKNREYQALFQKYSERMGVDGVVEGIQNDLEAARSDVSRLEDDKAALQHQLEEARGEIEAERRRTTDALSEAEAEREKSVGDVQRELAERISQLEGERDELLARLQAEATDTARTLADLGRLLDVDDADAVQLREALSGLKRQLGSRDETVSARETRIAALEERVRGLEADLAARDLELANTQRDFRQYRESKHDEMSTLQAQAVEFPPERFQELSDKLVRVSNENRDLKSIAEDISFILGQGYQVDPEAIKREIKGLKTSIQQYEEQEAALNARLSDVDRAVAEREEEKNRFMAKAKELEVARDGLRKELEETGRELKKLKAVGERFSQERFAEIEQQLQKSSDENDELQKANRTYLKKVSGLIEEKEALEAKVDELNTRLFDDRKQKELEDVIGSVQEQKDALAARLATFEANTGGFVEAFGDKYGDWKMNLQIVTGITEDLQDELASNPIAFETVKGLARHLDLLRDGSNELKRLLYEFRERVAKE